MKKITLLTVVVILSAMAILGAGCEGPHGGGPRVGGGGGHHGGGGGGGGHHGR